MNPFDQLAGYDQELGLAGFSLSKTIKKIRKEIKRVDKKLGIDKVKKALKIDKLEKATDKAIIQTSNEIQRSKVAQAALIVAAGVVAGPAALALMKTAGGAVASGAGALFKGAGAVASGIGSIAGTVAKTAVTTALTNAVAGGRAATGNAAADAAMVEEARRIDALNQRIASDPAFAQIVAQMQARGATDKEIMDMWAQSQTYYDLAVPQVESAVYPALYQQYQSAGYGGGAADMAAYESAVIADNAVKQVQNTAKIESAMTWLVPAGLIGLALVA